MFAKYALTALALLWVGWLLPLQAQTTASPTPQTPSLQVWSRSLTDVLDRLEYVADLLDQAQDIRTLKVLVFLSRLQGKGVQGIHPDKPIGLYAFFKDDLINSSFVLLIPIADRDAFINELLKQRLGCSVDKQVDGLYRLRLPDDQPLLGVGIDTLYVRFQQDYAYIARYAADTEPKRLIPARTFFQDSDGALLGIQLQLHHIAEDFKKFVVAELEMNIDEQLRREPPQDEVGKFVARWLTKHIVNLVQTTLLEAETVKVRLYVEPRQEQLRAEVSLTAKKGTLLARNFHRFAEHQSLAAGIVRAIGQKMNVAGVHWELTPQARQEFADMVKKAADTLMQQAGPDEQEYVEGLFKAILPTLQRGKLDVAAALVPIEGKKQHTLLAALVTQEGQRIETFLKTLAPILNAVDLADFSFDREKLKQFRIHKVVVNGLPERIERLCGTSTVWLAVSDRCLVVSVEEDGKLLQTAIQNGRVVTPPLLHVDMSATQMLPLLYPHLHPDEIKALLHDVFGKKEPTDRDRIHMQLTGGDQLRLHIQVHGGVWRLFKAAELFGPHPSPDAPQPK
jgi:hypothetical protein